MVCRYTGECGVRQIFIRTDDSINFTSPGYPSTYGNDIICVWTVIATDDTKVLVEFISFEMERGYDFFILGNGEDPGQSSSVIGRLTGNVILRTLTSDGSDMWMKLVTDGTGTRRGFHIDIRRIEHTDGKVSSIWNSIVVLNYELKFCFQCFQTILISKFCHIANSYSDNVILTSGSIISTM